MLESLTVDEEKMASICFFTRHIILCIASAVLQQLNEVRLKAFSTTCSLFSFVHSGLMEFIPSPWSFR